MSSSTTHGEDRDHRYVVGLIGTGIATSLSPALHEREARALGLRYAYRRLDLDELGLAPPDADALVGDAQRRGFAGVNVTHPCKRIVAAGLDELSPVAATLGAVNTVVFDRDRRVGHNTDASGFRRAFAEGLDGAARDHVVVLGAGGAGAAVAHALATHGARRIAVVDLDDGRAAELAEILGRRFGAACAQAMPADDLEALLAHADGVVHATPTGMAAHPGLPFPAAWLDERLWVAEVVYRPLETAMLRAARVAGCRTLDGGRMAVFQAADALELFTGRRVDRRRMLRHFAALVAADDARPREAAVR